MSNQENPDWQLIVTENAIRLLEDAKVLFHARRFGTCLALAVLAVEEAGKAILLRDLEQGAQNKDTRAHIGKQAKAASHLVAHAFLDRLSDAGYEVKHISTLVDWQKAWLLTTAAAAAQEKIVEEIARDSGFRQICEILRKIKNGDLNKAKQRGFYVDVGANLELINDPSTVSETEARPILKLAEEAIEIISALAGRNAGSA
jgi:AbiV family abortive infection protein